jgi:recombination protein RecA
MSQIDFGEICEEFGDVFVPTVENNDRITAKTFIPMVKEFQPVLMKEGLPCGHIIHVAGDSDTGKTTFVTEVVVQTQKAGGIALYSLTEVKYDLARAIDMGLDRNRLLITKPRSIEYLFENGKKVILKIREKYPDVPLVWVWDSISATPSEHELDDGSKDHNMKAANAIAGQLRRIRNFLDVNDVAFLMVNRIYEKQLTGGYGKKTTTYGGKSPKGMASIQIEFAKIKTNVVQRKGEKHKCGITTRIENTKHHLGVPFKTVDVMIDKKGFVIDRKVVI